MKGVQGRDTLFFPAVCVDAPVRTYVFFLFLCVSLPPRVTRLCSSFRSNTFFVPRVLRVGVELLAVFFLLLLHAGRTSLNGKDAMAPRMHVLQVHTYHPPRDVVVVRNSPEMSHVSKAAFGFHSVHKFAHHHPLDYPDL